MSDDDALDIRSAKLVDKPLLAGLMQQYLAEFATFETVEKDAGGNYVYPYLDHYWGDPNRYPFLFHIADAPAGFALLRFEADPVTGQAVMHVAEFFVLPAYRQRGIGARAAARLWDLFPGQWSLQVLRSNKNAYPFWKRVVSDYTDNNYSEQPPAQAIGGAFTFTFMSATDTDLPDDIEPDIFDF